MAVREDDDGQSPAHSDGSGCFYDDDDEEEFRQSGSEEEEDEGDGRDEEFRPDDDDDNEDGGRAASGAFSSSSDADRKKQNVDALLRGNLVVRRQALLPRVLSVAEGAAVARRPFKPPCRNGYSDQNGELGRRLCIRKREGVQFMFECVAGLSKEPDINGCILADDMGLGKTLQSITLLYTLLRQGFDGKPLAKRVMIITPTSLVSNWESEIKKWLDKRVQVIALCEATRADVVVGIDNYLAPCSHYEILIVSYETFRMHSSRFEKPGSCDLLICDEAHRLKNDQTLTNKALASLSCTRRVLLSGTPMQNDLEEFFAMVNFTNPGILGDASYFRRYYEAPIVAGREPGATAEERQLGLERSAELSMKVNQFILRRTNALLSEHLPPKIVEVVCCKLTPLQVALYNHFIQSKNVKRAIVEDVKQSKILAYITALKKLCNHPKLIFDAIRSGGSGSGFEDCLHLFPPELFSGRSGSWTGGGGIWVELSGKMHVLARLLAHLRQRTDDRVVLVSNYTQTLDLFAQLCRERRYPFLRLDGSTSISKRQKLVNRFNDISKDEFVFLLSSKAGGCGLNLIGGNRLVLFDPDWNPANDKQAAARVWRDGQKKRVYIYRFLTAGTIEEKVYQRQMSKEGLQKVIQQEQLENLGLQANLISTEDLRDLFTLHANIRSEIHENMNCARCNTNNMQVEDGIKSLTQYVFERRVAEDVCHTDQPDADIGGFAKIAGCLEELKNSEKQLGRPLEEDLASWGHHSSSTTVPDVILQASAGEEVTFVFTNQVDGKLVPVEPMERKSPVSDTILMKPLNPSSALSSHKVSASSHLIEDSTIWRTSGAFPPLQKLPKFPMTAKHTNTSVNSVSKESISHKIQLPVKRISAEIDDDDDDFV
ncbi:DNA repair and recombination protein RAD54 isoform X2 [Nymphaea colorata]|uniref:DNA repair and recombination protein RAD54 isoform X2 n=1 Tax=Nymphaea colorata TaxID=210225 RepID=UPI00214E9BE5|nr:DNA repair and recombination protein RAD54 isoform X2 [Nymphaea colorata]